MVLSVSEWDFRSRPEVSELLRKPVADPLNFPVGNVTRRDYKYRDNWVFHFVCIAPPGAHRVRPGKLDVELISDAVEHHDQIRRASAIEVWVNLCTLPGSQ